MASTISAGTTTTTALVYSADTSGVLQLQTNGGTTALTLDTSQNATFAGKVASASSLQLATNGTTTAVTIDTAQNMGLGVTPSAWSGVTAFQNKSASVAVTSNGNNMDLATNRYYNGTSDLFYQTGNYALMYEQASGSGVHRWFTSTATGTAGNAITFTQAMSLDASGNLLVGKTSAGNAINGAQLSSTYQFFTNTSDYISIFNRRGTDGISVYFQKAETNVGNISVTTSATAYNTSSDYRLKNITGALTGAKDFIMSLQPKQGTWKADGSKFVGFLAHEFQEVSPSSVTGEKDAVDADGKPIMQSMQASSSEVMANLISLVQEQQAIIESLKARLDAANL